MSSLTFIAPGGVSTFNIPVHNKTATATVNGSAATLSAQGDNSVTFQSIPSKGDSVVISYTEVPNYSNKSPIIVLGQKNTTVTAPADVNENTLYSLTIPAGLMGPNDSLRVTFAATNTNNANVKTYRVKLGTISVAFTGTSANGAAGQAKITNRNSLSNQITHTNQVGATASVAAYSVDMSQTQTLSVAVQKATGTDTASLESVLVELIRGV